MWTTEIVVFAVVVFACGAIIAWYDDQTNNSNLTLHPVSSDGDLTMINDGVSQRITGYNVVVKGSNGKIYRGRESVLYKNGHVIIDGVEQKD